MKSPILITGCARSRTSLVAGIIDICGAWGGSICGPTSFNKKGQFENREVIDSIVKPYLISIDADSMGQYPLPRLDQPRNKDKIKQLKEKIISIMDKQGLESESIWYLKGAKFVLMWEVLNEIFPESKWVWVDRNIDSIIKSCLRTPFMKAYSTYEGWECWVNNYRRRFMEMTHSIDVINVNTDEIIKGDLSNIEVVIDWLDLNWEEKKVKDFIDPSLTEL